MGWLSFFLRSKYTYFLLVFCLGLFLPDFLRGFNSKVKQKKARELDILAAKRQNETLALHCEPRNYQRHLATLSKKRYALCFCKPLRFFKGGCAAKLEIFSRRPFVVKIHGYFKTKSERIGKYADEVTMRPVMFGNEYGHAWVSPYINSEDGVLTGDMPVVQEIFEDLAKSIGLVYPCGGKPGAAIVRYKKGGFVGLHYDAPDLRVEKKLGYFLGARIFRSAVAWLEDCRHFYDQMNIWKCLYLAARGKLEASTSWDNYLYGPQIATVLIQLSDLQGGETYFPLVNVTAQTQKGDVLIWGNIDDRWQREPRSMHGGCPVLTNEKLIVVTFIPGKCNTFKELGRRMARPAEKF